MNILIVKTSAIGDVTHTLPVLNALRKHYPGAKITWLVEESAADLVKGHRALDRILVSRRKQWAAEMRGGGACFIKAWREIRDFIRDLRGTRYDLLFDFQGLLKSGIWVWLADADRKIGFGRGMEHSECSYIFLNERIAPVPMDTHALRREMALLKAVGIETEEIVFDLPITERDRAEVENLLAGHGIDRQKKLVAINPVATWPTKLWFKERFAEVADRLLERGCAVVFTGSPADRGEIDRIISSMKGRAVNLAGKTSLMSLAALYQEADVVVSTDTGPMHIAAAAGAPLVAIFGSTAPWRTGPWGEEHLVLRADLDCSPCLKRNCPENSECMRAISVEQVVAAVNEILGRDQRVKNGEPQTFPCGESGWRC
ncbi:MAG: lipopolysaccharide heptosyltransferase I [Desulfobulbaceae bacterium]|nr:lipopolysaccharide heptosyltransferase I [Desulfobulbaceae bacterium]